MSWLADQTAEIREIMPHLLTKPCQKQHHLTAGTQNPTGMFKGILGLKRGPFIMCICWGYCSYHLLAIIPESFKRKFTAPSISGTSGIWQKVSYLIYRPHGPGRLLKAGINKRDLIAQQTEINREET